MQPLSNLLRQQALDSSSSSGGSEAGEAALLQRVQDVCRFLNVTVLVRGYKTVVKFFPHEAADLERVLGVLQVWLRGY